MQGLNNFTEVYLHRDPVDMRKSINGLSMIVLEEMRIAFKGERLFVFVSRCGRRLKLLYWDKSGFALWYKRLEKQRFHWPKSDEMEVVVSCSEQLQKLLIGYDVFQKPHHYLQYEQIG
jgi:transposase